MFGERVLGTKYVFHFIYSMFVDPCIVV